MKENDKGNQREI